MGGQADYTNDPGLDYGTDPAHLVVYRYDPDKDDEAERYVACPNVSCLSVEFFHGPRPPEARFRYVFDDVFPDPADPLYIEDAMPLDAKSPGVVPADTRLAVFVTNPDGSDSVIWDGFAQVPQANAGDQEAVTFTGLGTPVREWDRPVAGAWYRDGTDPRHGAEMETQEHPRFNPDGEPNCTPFGYDHGGPLWDPAVTLKLAFPVFYDERIVRDPDDRRKWTLSKAARYLIGHTALYGISRDPEAWTTFLDPVNYDAVLESWIPYPDPDGDIDPSDVTTYLAEDIFVQDLDVWSDPWPVALGKLINPHGFDFTWRLTEDENLDPKWVMEIYRLDDAGVVKTLQLQKAAAPGVPRALDPALTNVHGLVLQRDGQRLANRFLSQGSMGRHEVGVILAPGFEIDPADADPANLHKWDAGSPDFDPVKYRVYIADECADGHWDFATGTFGPTKYLDLNDVFGDPDADGRPVWAVRRRPGEGHLLTRDAQGERLPAELYVSNVVPEKYPAVRNYLDKSNWQKVATGGWDLLPDQLGIRLTKPDLENYVPTKRGVVLPPTAPFPAGMRVVTCMAKPSVPPEVTTPRFWFMLVTTIKADRGVQGKALRRFVSPGLFTVEKFVDNKGWFHYEAVDDSSPYWVGEGAVGGFGNQPSDVLVDDGKEAQAQAMAHRRAHELGSFAGSVTVNRFTRAYEIGDRVSGVEGRDISLRQNLGAGAGEAPVYPVVVGFRWNFDQAQTSVLSLADRRGDPPPERRR